MTTSNTLQRPWLDRREAAAYLGITVDTLAQMATRGDGPVFSKPTKRIVRYSVAELDAWMTAYARTSSRPQK